jgi:hypothetical protein
MAEFVEVHNLFNSFNDRMSVHTGKIMCCPLSGNSPHMGYWAKRGMEVSSITAPFTSRMPNSLYLVFTLVLDGFSM